MYYFIKRCYLMSKITDEKLEEYCEAGWITEEQKSEIMGSKTEL